MQIRTKTMQFHLISFTGDAPRKGKRIPLKKSNTMSNATRKLGMAICLIKFGRHTMARGIWTTG